jgi:hypothetical protein
MKFAKRVFLVAGIYGLIVLLPMYLMEAKTGRDYPPPITHPEYYYGFIGVGVAFQVLFLVLSTNPLRYRPMMIPAMIEKFSFVIAAIILFLQNRIPVAVLMAAGIDCILGVLFVIAYLKTAIEQHSETESWSNK